ncbi:glycosyltransferase family 2 protein [Oculatella sp. LEGE 06141]|uniref:glycosyltransferase family 2 protein n=1 Tax=Oculatella sp. LEGE 06141 TaxID=1828648 RepID=UPI00188031E8|nr:glycosyltransferase family A protein [Oculatella sp. LEGE 06141]MBE9178463.1 glycosyltransferase family 2 protein [Oculatella sp. LEGE 06141]
MPLVSVIIPAYNAEPFLERTLESVLSQTYNHLEVLVIDDGSTDRTVELVQSVAQRDRRVRLLQQPNSGVAIARNSGIQAAQGEFIAPIDADDIWYPQKLEKQVRVMLQDTSAGLVYTWSIYLNETGELTGGYKTSRLEGNVYFALIQGNFVGNASAPLIRRTCFDQVGTYNHQLKAQNAQGCEDWDLYLRMAERYPFRVVPEFLVGYRQTVSSMSRNYAAMSRSHSLTMAEARRRNPDAPAVVYRWSSSRYCACLAMQSSWCGDYQDSLVWMCKAIALDLTLLLQKQTYELLFKSALKQMARPFVSGMGGDRGSGLWAKRRVEMSRTGVSIAELNTRAVEETQPQSWYHTVQARRWQRIIEGASTPFPQGQQQG